MHDLFDRHGATDQIALKLIAFILTQEGGFLDRFHALGHDIHAQPFAQPDDHLHDGNSAFLLPEGNNEVTVNLDGVKRIFGQVGKR